MKYLLIVLFAFALCSAKTDTLIVVFDGKVVAFRQAPKEDSQFDTLFIRTYLQGEKRLALK
jgi:hypothetical protein